LHDGSAQTIKGPPAPAFVSLVATRIAIADANQTATAGNVELDWDFSNGYQPASIVEYLRLDNANILSVSSESLAVRKQRQLYGSAGGLTCNGEYRLAILVTSGFQYASCEFYFPLHM